MTMKTTMPIASRRTFVGLGGGVLAAALSALARGAAPPAVPGAPAPGEAYAEKRFRTIDVGDNGHFALEDHCAEIGSLTRGLLARVMPASSINN